MAIDGGSVEIRFEGDVAPLRRSVEEAVESLESVREAAEDVDNSLAKSSFDGFGKKAREEFTEFSDAAGEAFTEAIDKADSFIGQLGSIGQSLKAIGSTALTAGATAATGALVKMAKGAIQDTSALENTQIQMIGLTHSVEDGNKAMAMAVKYFKNNPFNRFEVTNATKSLIQFGAELEDVPALLDKLGKVALSTGANIDTMAYYYQRNISDGRIAVRDLLQMQNQGIPIFQALAEQIGVTSGAVREMAAKGKIAIEDFQGAFDRLVDDKAMERFNATLSRQVDRFKGRMSNMRAALAGYTTSMENGLEISENGLYRAATRFLKTFADIMDSETGKRIYEGFEKIGNAIASFIDKITGLMEPAMNAFSKLLNFLGDNSELLIPILGGLVVALGRLGSFLPGIGPVIDKVSRSFGGLFQGIKGLVSTHPLLSAFMALLGVGFMDAMKNDEEFKKTIGELTGALREMVSNLMEAVRGVLPVFVNLIKELASSGVIKGVLTAAANALSWIAKALASIPPEVLASLMSFFVSLKLLNANPIMFAVTAIGLLIQYVKELGGIGKIFERLPDTLRTIGHNIMTGLFNGVKEGAQKVVNFVKQVASAIIGTFKNMFGIHSPSTVMYDMGMNMGLGLANGITDSESAVELAMSNLAEDILKLSEKIISNKVDFGILDIKAEWQEWKKVSKLFTEGSEQYNYAIQKMEDTRKKANLKILELQRNYNDALDNTIKKISSMYGLFDEVNLGGSKNSSKILKNLDQQVAKMQEWAEAQKSIANLGLDDELVKELQAMGVDATGELSAIAQMTADELGTLNDMWLKKQSIANEAGVKQMEGLKNDTLDEINELKKGIDGTTVDISDAGGRLVENIAEGVYGAMPTLEGAMSQLGDYIEKAKRELSKSMSGEGGSAMGGTPLAPDAGGVDGIGAIKEEIQGSIEKVKSMLPNILLGMLGAVGVVKFGPKILKAIANKLLGGGLFSQGLSGAIEAGLAGELGKGNISQLLGQLPYGDRGFLARVVGKLQGKLEGDTGVVSEEMQKAASNLAKAKKPAESIAENSTIISKGVETTGQGMSKASGWMRTIQEGAKTVIYIAGAIAAVAGACWLAYNALKDVDWGKFTVCLLEMVEAVVAFGALAKAADMLKIGAKEILVIAGLAADIGIAALACRVAYELMEGIDFLKFQLVLLEMAEALVVMGALATAAGVVMEATLGAMALGMLAVIGLAGDIAVAAVAIKFAYDKLVPIDFGKFQLVILEMIEALGVMGGFSTLFGILAPLVGLGWLSIIAICDELCKTADALYKVYTTVPDDFDGVNKKIDLIKSVLNKIIDTDLGSLIGSIVASWEVGPLTRVMDMYVRVAEQLERISQVTIDERRVTSNMDQVKLALERVKSKTDLISGWLQAWADEANASSVESAGKVLLIYGQIVDTLGKLGDVKVNDNVLTGVQTMTDFVQTVLDTISTVTTNWWVDVGAIERSIGLAESILNKFSEMIPTIQNQIQGESIDKESAVKTITAVHDIVYELGKVNEFGNMENKEKVVGYSQSILNKFTGILPTVKQLIQDGISEQEKETATGTIHTVQDLLYEIGKINERGGIENKEKIVGYTQSILNKFTELIPTIKQLVDLKVNTDDAKKAVEDVRDLVYQIGQINEEHSNSLATKEWIVGMASSIAWKLVEFADAVRNIGSVDENATTTVLSAMNSMLDNVANSLSEKAVSFENVGVKIGESLRNGLTSQNALLTEAGISMQSAVWSGIEGKMNDEYQQGVWMATQFGNGLKSVSFDNIGAQMQSSLWWAIQNRMQDEYYQGQTMGYRFRQGLYDVDYGNAGWWAVKGFENGAWALYGSVYNTGWWIANRFLQGLRDRGQQGSPWKTTMESGAWAVEGLIEGMKESESELVGEANSLADQVVDALTMDNLSMNPSLDVGYGYSGGLAPSMDIEGSYARGNGNVIINQNNTNYTEYDVEQVQRDLAWELSKV